MKKIVKRILLITVAIYIVYTFISQQKMLNAYATESNEYNNQIEEAKTTRNDLNDTLKSLNSTNYIENIARDKLDMYLPNERVYIDITK